MINTIQVLKIFINLILIFSNYSQANEVCQVSLANETNKVMNEKLKKHQKLGFMSIETEENPLPENYFHSVIVVSRQLKIKFTTQEGKKFESTYDIYHREKKIWKVNAAKTQIFPDLYKNYIDITLNQGSNDKLHEIYTLRMYDINDKNYFQFLFSTEDCFKPQNKKIILGSKIEEK